MGVGGGGGVGVSKKLFPDKKTKFEAYYPTLFFRLRNSFEISEDLHLVFIF